MSSTKSEPESEAGSDFLVTCSQFEGCLVGGLIGDCLGFPFENDFEHQYSNSKIEQFFEGLKIKKGSSKNLMQYTDDTSMLKSVTQQLIVNGPSVNPFLLSKIFVETKSREKWDRNYPDELIEIFDELKKSECLDPFRPATRQNGGHGLVSNVAASRVAPLALVVGSSGNLESLVEQVIISSRLTHAHPASIMGAVFQAMAVQQALAYSQRQYPPGTDVAAQFIGEYKRNFKTFRTATEFKNFFAQEFFSHKSLSLYMERLRAISDLLKLGNAELDVSNVRSILGVKTRAVDSIPTALFIFLAAFKPIPFIKTDNQFERTIQLAICMGGDTDTIGAMAGNIAGAFLGIEGIPEYLMKHCEDSKDIQVLAEKLFRKLHN